MNRFLPLLAALLVVAAACGTSNETTTIEIADEYAVLRLTGTSGDVTIRGDNAATGTEIEATVNYSGEKAEVVASIFGGDLVIGDTCGDQTDCWTDYIITVPTNTSTFVTTESGSVAIASVDDEVTISTQSGNVTVSDVAGSIEVNIGSGNVLGVGLRGSMAFVTSTSGAVDLSFDDPISDVRVTSDSGDITVQAPGDPYNVSASSSSGGVDVNIETSESATGSIEIESASGDVKIYRK